MQRLIWLNEFILQKSIKSVELLAQTVNGVLTMAHKQILFHSGA
jgi:hypothetical protein